MLMGMLCALHFAMISARPASIDYAGHRIVTGDNVPAFGFVTIAPLAMIKSTMNPPYPLARPE